MTLLDIDTNAFNSLTEYGVLGLLVLGLGSVLWFMLKRQLASEDSLKTKVGILEKELRDYIKNDQNKMRETIENNTKAFESLKTIILDRINIRQNK